MYKAPLKAPNIRSHITVSWSGLKDWRTSVLSTHYSFWIAVNASVLNSWTIWLELTLNVTPPHTRQIRLSMLLYWRLVFQQSRHSIISHHKPVIQFKLHPYMLKLAGNPRVWQFNWHLVWACMGAFKGQFTLYGSSSYGYGSFMFQQNVAVFTLYI